MKFKRNVYLKTKISSLKRILKSINSLKMNQEKREKEQITSMRLTAEIMTDLKKTLKR